MQFSIEQPIRLVTVSRMPKAHFGQGTPPVLHKADCRHVIKTDPKNIYDEGLWTADEAFRSVCLQFDRACGTCLPHFEDKGEF